MSRFVLEPRGVLAGGARGRSRAPERASGELRELPGVGPFTADGMVVRGAGAPDHIPLAEPRLARAVTMACGLPAPPRPERLAEIAERWRPFRSWVAVLLRVHLEDALGSSRAA